MGIAVLDARQLAKSNKSRHEKLKARYDALLKANEAEKERAEEVRLRVFEQVLQPFAESFARLKNTDLGELESLDDIPGCANPSVELRDVRVSATGAVGSLVGGAALGAGAGAVTFTAVGAFAAASTGTAISALSGAAATSATLAWLGGGSLAAGGGGVAAGTTVLTGIVAAPVALVAIGFVEYQGRKARRQQREVAVDLGKAESELGLAETRCRAIRERSGQINRVLERLLLLMRPRVVDLERLVSAKDDYLTFTAQERAELAKTVSLVTTIVTVLQTPLFDENGVVTDLSKQVVDDARARAHAAGA